MSKAAGLQRFPLQIANQADSVGRTAPSGSSLRLLCFAELHRFLPSWRSWGCWQGCVRGSQQRLPWRPWGCWVPPASSRILPCRHCSRAASFASCWRRELRRRPCAEAAAAPPGCPGCCPCCPPPGYRRQIGRCRCGYVKARGLLSAGGSGEERCRDVIRDRTLVVLLA